MRASDRLAVSMAEQLIRLSRAGKFATSTDPSIGEVAILDTDGNSFEMKTVETFLYEDDEWQRMWAHLVDLPPQEPTLETISVPFSRYDFKGVIIQPVPSGKFLRDPSQPLDPETAIYQTAEEWAKECELMGELRLPDRTPYFPPFIDAPPSPYEQGTPDQTGTGDADETQDETEDTREHVARPLDDDTVVPIRAGILPQGVSKPDPDETEYWMKQLMKLRAKKAGKEK